MASSAETVDYEVLSFGKWGALMNAGALEQVTYQQSLASVALNEYRLGYITKEQLDAQLSQYKSRSNKDQISKELLDNPFTQQYNLSLASGTKRSTHNVSLLFEDTKSNFKGTGNKKYNLNYRGSADIFKWLTFSFMAQANYYKESNNGVTLDDIKGMSPYEMLRNEDGSFANVTRYYTPTLDRFVPTSRFPYADWTYNPIQEYQNREITSEQMSNRLQGELRFKPISGLTVDSRIQYELVNQNNKSVYNDNTFFVRNLVNTSSTWDQSTNAITLNLPKGGILDQDKYEIETYSFRNSVNYVHKFGEKHEINLVAGTEINNTIRQSFGHPRTYGYNDQTLSVGALPNGTGDVSSIPDWLGADQYFGSFNSFSYSTDRYFSAYANAAYTFNDRYTVSGSIRTDASNLITEIPSYRYAPFWSAGLGWQLDKEQFIKKFDWVDKLNVRATYGYNGNVDRFSSFRPLISFNLNPNAYTGDRTASIRNFGNPTQRWEKTATVNLGVDFSIFHSKLYGKIDLYNKYGTDLIADLSVPAVFGTASQRFNNAKMTNKGVELELGTSQHISRNIVWQGGFNISYNKNKVTDLFVSNYSATNLTARAAGAAYVEGYNANTLWRYRYAGTVNGQPMVHGPNGTLYNITAFTPGDGRDYLEDVGTSVAPYTLGFHSNVRVYDFNLSFIVTGKFGHVFQRTGFNYPVSWSFRNLPNNKIGEINGGDPSKIVLLPTDPLEPRFYFWSNFTQNLSSLIESASHLRMQEVSLSYKLPAKTLNKIKINRCELFLVGNDLFTILSNNVGEDPEYPVGTVKPQPRITMSLKCEF